MFGVYSGWRVKENEQSAKVIAGFLARCNQRNIRGIFPVSYPTEGYDVDVLLIHRGDEVSGEVVHVGNRWNITQKGRLMHLGNLKGELIGATYERTYGNVMRVLRGLDKHGYSLPEFEGLDKLPEEAQRLAGKSEVMFQKADGSNLLDKLINMNVELRDKSFLGEQPAQHIRILRYLFDVATPVTLVLDKRKYFADFHLTDQGIHIDILRATFEYGLRELPKDFEQRIPFEAQQMKKQRSGAGYIVDEAVFVPRGDDSSPAMMFSRNGLIGELSFVNGGRRGKFPNRNIGIRDVNQFSALVDCLTGEHKNVRDLVVT